MWFVRKSKYVELAAELAALQIHCETLQAEINILLAKVQEADQARELAETALAEKKRPARKKTKRGGESAG